MKAYVNRQLSRTADFKGTVDDIDIHLIRGAYTIQRVQIFRTTGRIPVPFFSAVELTCRSNGRNCYMAPLLEKWICGGPNGEHCFSQSICGSPGHKASLQRQF